MTILRPGQYKLKLFHFSDAPGLKLFVPRAPLRHPDSEPLVYAIDGPHACLYLFLRECPRIGFWQEDGPIEIWIDATWEARWREGEIYCYKFEPVCFEDCSDHGVWVSRSPVRPIEVSLITDLPAAASGVVKVRDSLATAAKELYDFDTKVFLYPGHVSMIRCGNLSDWPGQIGTPVEPPIA